MMTHSKHLAAVAGLAFAAFASASAASAQAVTDPALSQPAAVAPVAAPAPAAYPATSAYPAAAGALPAQPYNAGPPPMMGAVAGTTAADRDGDGIVDGYYTSDGFYHPYISPTPAPAPRYLSRRGERG